MATFDGPGRAIHCALDLRAALQGIGAVVRIGLHTGEIELRHDDIGGLTVHIAARVMGEAGAGEVLISRAVRDLLSGSDITLEDRGVHVLKGVDGQWPLFAVTQVSREVVGGSDNARCPGLEGGRRSRHPPG